MLHFLRVLPIPTIKKVFRVKRVPTIIRHLNNTEKHNQMAAGTNDFCCIKVQQMLDNVANGNSPFSKVLETHGFMESLVSPQNTNGVEKLQTESAAGKARPTGASNRKVQVEYAVRQCATTTAAAASLCDSGTPATNDLLYDDAQVLQVRSTEFSLGKEEFRDLCEQPSDRQSRMFINAFNNLKRDINNDLITSYRAVMGNYFTEAGAVPVDSSVAPKTLFLFNAAAQTNALGFYPMQRDFNRSMWSGRPIVVGGTLLDAWKSATPAFAGNNEGLDASRATAPFNMFPDYQVDTNFADGAQHMLQYAPHTVQMLEWYANIGIYEEIKPDYQETTLTFDGMTVDFTVNYDKCTKTWVFTFTKWFDLWNLPTTSLSAACDQDSNGILQYLMDCQDVDCSYIKS